VALKLFRDGRAVCPSARCSTQFPSKHPRALVVSTNRSTLPDRCSASILPTKNSQRRRGALRVDDLSYKISNRRHRSLPEADSAVVDQNSRACISRLAGQLGTVLGMYGYFSIDPRWLFYLASQVAKGLSVAGLFDAEIAIHDR